MMKLEKFNELCAEPKHPDSHPDSRRCMCDCFDLQPRGSNKQRLGFSEVLKEKLASGKMFGRRRTCLC
jgi:hypothetical protein